MARFVLTLSLSIALLTAGAMVPAQPLSQTGKPFTADCCARA
jgi:hypothetical protein